MMCCTYSVTYSQKSTHCQHCLCQLPYINNNSNSSHAYHAVQGVCSPMYCLSSFALCQQHGITPHIRSAHAAAGRTVLAAWLVCMLASWGMQGLNTAFQSLSAQHLPYSCAAARVVEVSSVEMCKHGTTSPCSLLCYQSQECLHLATHVLSIMNNHEQSTMLKAMVTDMTSTHEIDIA